jgi:hypothetical protein
MTINKNFLSIAGTNLIICRDTLSTSFFGVISIAFYSFFIELLKILSFVIPLKIISIIDKNNSFNLNTPISLKGQYTLTLPSMIGLFFLLICTLFFAQFLFRKTKKRIFSNFVSNCKALNKSYNLKEKFLMRRFEFSVRVVELIIFISFSVSVNFHLSFFIGTVFVLLLFNYYLGFKYIFSILSILEIQPFSYQFLKKYLKSIDLVNYFLVFILVIIHHIFFDILDFHILIFALYLLKLSLNSLSNLLLELSKVRLV